MSTVSLLDTPSLPLSTDQLTQLEAATSGLSPTALLWASGYLAGLARRAQPIALDTRVSPAQRPQSVLTVLYGSQTGNGRRLAEQLVATSHAAGVAARLISLADFNVRTLKQERAVIFVVSTHGDGDPPDDAVGLYRYLVNPQAARLDQLAYTVLALGDSSYPQFCQTGRDFDTRLAALGAHACVPSLECDVDLAAATPTWMAATIGVFSPLLPAPPARISLVENAPPSTPSATQAVTEVRLDATLLLNQRLSGRRSSKEVRHLEFSVDTGRFSYEPGDSVSLWASNPACVVAEILSLNDWAPNTPVTLGGRTHRLEDALSRELEITQLSRPVLVALAALSGESSLTQLLDSHDNAALGRYLRERQIVDVLREGAFTLGAQQFVALCRPLAARAYSIASSRMATPDEVHLSVARVVGERDARPRPGCASNYLAELAPGAQLSLRLDRNPAFRLPRNGDAPVIMIGPGTGVAPFRAFVEERAAQGAKGRNWLFFGERTQREDFLYQTEWQRHLRQGTLSRLELAFSRDGAQKIYVQDRLRACAADLYDWLAQGASVYVCGDAQRMAKDVHAALVDIIATRGGVDSEAAEDFLLNLRQQGRYQRDVY